MPGETNLLTTYVLLHLALSALYLVPLFNALKKTRRNDLAYLAAAFIGAGALLHFVLAAAQAGWAAPTFSEHLIWYVLPALAWLIWLLAARFVQNQSSRTPFIAGGLLFLALFVLDSNLPGLPDIVWENASYYLPRYRLVFGLAIAVWTFFLGAAIWTTYRAYRTTWQTLHRNRISYWTVIFALLVTHDILVWNGQGANAILLQLAAIFLLVYLINTHRLPDARQIMRSGLTYLLAAIAISVFYTLIYMLILWVNRRIGQVDFFLISLISALAAVFSFNPLWRNMAAFIERLLPMETYDPAETLRNYGAQISNLIRLKELAQVSVSLIIEALELKRGFLFLVDRVPDTQQHIKYRLRNANPESMRSIRPGILDEESPIVQTLLKNQPLLQYDIDLLPIYQQAAPAERTWLASLNCEIYVPIFSKGQWIGLLALGGKLSGNRYTQEDEKVLGTIANQTAIALENARLVENLTRLNQEIKTAYQSLDQANRHLEQLDRTKSNFISIASHELRTPLTVMRGYIEMLIAEPALLENPYHKQMLEGIYQGTLRLHEIMDSLFDIAQIDSRTLELHLQPINLGELIKAVSAELENKIKERQQTIDLQIASLPVIKADPNTLRKVFYHLLTNAIKFTPDGGHITIHGRTYTASREYPHGAVEIVVSDTGIGVDPNFRELIFTKFYQPEDELNHHSTGKTKFKGSGAGLGLALSRGIVEAHGGKIWVESPGYDEVNFPGSDFHVLLPIRHPRETKTQSLPESLAQN